ncbi:putative secreted protein [Granulibacter bethesdensis]|uniref:Secreted protein n=1 Tax=Granulibacter bethesdensis TaxID=364410 RepID=A0AAC9P9Q1_9PROT|nr:hypothetical protein [Granulibacter bethesdensis]APH55279.1 putative secreted protein [Granulibacter bethesdensis]APH62866.1 putative secreted protein [Granulibacter bethesdensis]
MRYPVSIVLAFILAACSAPAPKEGSAAPTPPPPEKAPVANVVTPTPSAAPDSAAANTVPAEPDHCDAKALSHADYKACLKHLHMGQFHGHPTYYGLH